MTGGSKRPRSTQVTEGPERAPARAASTEIPFCRCQAGCRANWMSSPAHSSIPLRQVSTVAAA